MSKSIDKPFSAKEMKSIKVALFCIVAVVIFYFGATFLKGINVFGKKNYYYAVFEDIGDLHESDNVTLNGYVIGKVNGIKLLSSRPVRICAEILITENLDIPEDSEFEVTQKDVLGGKVVNLHLGASPALAQRGDTLGCYLSRGMLDGVGDLVAQLQSVVSSADTIGQNLKLAFRTSDPVNGGLMIKNTLANLEQTTHDLSMLMADNGPKVNRVLSQLDALSKTLADAGPQIQAVVENLDNISDSLAQSNIRSFVNSAQLTIENANQILDDARNGRGTVGQLLQNDSVYNNINYTLDCINTLVKDVRQNPSKYINVTIFGKKVKTNQ
jgi:phospholipid/cholesterol/gamma-HCH transport system substrate-binding protein